MSPSTESSPNGQTDFTQSHASAEQRSSAAHLFGLTEIAGILRIQPEGVRWLTDAYADFLSETAQGEPPRYTHADLANLIDAQQQELEAATNGQNERYDGHSIDAPFSKSGVDHSQVYEGEPSHGQSVSAVRAEQGTQPPSVSAAPTADYVPSSFDGFRPVEEPAAAADAAGPAQNLPAQDINEASKPDSSPTTQREATPASVEPQPRYANGTSGTNGRVGHADAQAASSPSSPGFTQASAERATAATEERVPVGQMNHQAVEPERNTPEQTGFPKAQNQAQSPNSAQVQPAETPTPTSIERASGAPSSKSGTNLTTDVMLGEMLSTVATSQQSVLNVQDSIREMINVIAQDNFNLKHENRKLRERMLELERVIAEHQRREETRKEMLESRMRAVEGTLGALQQQLAQLVQLQRQRIKKNWFR